MTAQNPPIFLQAGSHPAEDVRQALTAIVGSAGGVVGASDLVVSERAGTANMSVDVAGGQAWVAGTESLYQGAYFCENRGVQNITVSLGDATNPRIDIIVARVKDSAYSGGSDAWELALIEGTAAASPTQPTAPANSVTLARIDVAAGASSVVNGDITDLRTFVAADQMRVVGDLVVDTDTLYVDSTNDRVGIGTSSPSFPLSVDIDAPATYGNASGNFAQMWTNSGTNALGVSLGDNLGAGLITNNGYDLHLGTSGTSRVTVQSGGNVGINDTTPSYTLDVDGDINATGDVRVAGNALPRGVVYLDQASGSDVTIGTTPVVIRTTSIVLETGRRYKISTNGYFYSFTHTTQGTIRIMDGANRLQLDAETTDSGKNHTVSFFAIKDGDGSSHTISVDAAVGTGSAMYSLASNRPAVLLIEDIGPS